MSKIWNAKERCRKKWRHFAKIWPLRHCNDAINFKSDLKVIFVNTNPHAKFGYPMTSERHFSPRPVQNALVK